ncbi:MAG: type II toxin-antitoxin system HicB family antitoxin [Burkholderiaceae bacterium]|nr:type II toxin-antitoxin system HicB family antitoxin [Burkholderiaceae bacterium]MCD8517993.1 type II toxin-antitoxin system HicB family antitoxin [Burkholderiaceae bacterium]MCD8536417.1 type II toxin-antitoxin system HicB family antitoxin [Burkholderiaceae bacterium]MCD8564844.1 type II toxin-antitoxin system HicB family antitoxin [Burkholderiaceae bacterium]
MKSTLLSHKGYHGSIEPSVRDGKLKGHILFIDEMITYSAPTIPELQDAFERAVDSYLEDCARTGKFPQRPFKGQFNVRIAPQLHQNAVLRAEAEGTSLNNVVVRALRNYLHEPELSQTEAQEQVTESEQALQQVNESEREAA